MDIPNIKTGDQFKFLTDGTIYELELIITHEIVNNRKKALPEPLFKFKGVNTPEDFTNRLQDIKRAFMFKQWIKIN